MESKNCKGCIHIRKYKSGNYFCSNSREAKVISTRGESHWPFRINKTADISCKSYEKGDEK